MTHDPTRGGYADSLARYLERGDLAICRPDWLERRGGHYPGRSIIVDHAAKLTDRQWAAWEALTGAVVEAAADDTVPAEFTEVDIPVAPPMHINCRCDAGGFVAGLLQAGILTAEDARRHLAAQNHSLPSMAAIHEYGGGGSTIPPRPFLAQHVNIEPMVENVMTPSGFVQFNAGPTRLHARSANGDEIVGHVISFDPNTGLAQVALAGNQRCEVSLPVYGGRRAGRSRPQSEPVPVPTWNSFGVDLNRRPVVRETGRFARLSGSDT